VVGERVYRPCLQTHDGGPIATRATVDPTTRTSPSTSKSTTPLTRGHGAPSPSEAHHTTAPSHSCDSLTSSYQFLHLVVLLARLELERRLADLLAEEPKTPTRTPASTPTNESKWSASVSTPTEVERRRSSRGSTSMLSTYSLGGVVLVVFTRHSRRKR